MDILRGSEVTFLYKGEEAFTGKITNRVPDENSGIITLEGLDWLGLLNERQISFMGYQTRLNSCTVSGAGYSWDDGTGGDTWAYAGDATGVPGMMQDLEGADLILRMLRHFTGRDMTDTEFGDPDNMPYVERSITYKPWRFEGETLFQSIDKVAKVMQASSLRFGYNFWVDGKKNWWLRRYGDQIYNKPVQAEWSPPKEDVSTIINHLHFIGGIATPFPSDRESLTDMTFKDGNAVIAKNLSGQDHAPPTAESKGWGCWVKRSDYDPSGEMKVKIECDDDLGFVTGANNTSLHITAEQSYAASRVYSIGVYYEIDNQYADFRDENYPDGELRNWSDRAQLHERVTHRVMTMTMYIRGQLSGNELYPTHWPTKMCGVKLKIYTGTPTFPPTTEAATDVYETAGEVYELDITDVFIAYKDKMDAWIADNPTDPTMEWMRLAFVFHEDIEPDDYNNLKQNSCNPGGDLIIRPKIEAITSQGGNLDILARWDVAQDKTLPDPADVWGFGLEFAMVSRIGQPSLEMAVDHLFFGFGEINVERWDDISIQANRHVEKWIQDRKCHAWNRAEHLADVLLDSMKYSQKSRTGVLRYFNPELRPNLLIPVSEFGVEWMYVLNQISVEVDAQGTNTKLSLGSMQPDTSELFGFYELQRVNAETGGTGKGIFDWVVNAPCQTNCERFCQFACLSDWSSSYKRGGSICQTARETTCQRCESAEEVNPCVVSCLKYSQIAAISQRPPSERTDIDNTLLIGDGYYTGVVPEKPITGKKLTKAEQKLKDYCSRYRHEVF